MFHSFHYLCFAFLSLWICTVSAQSVIAEDAISTDNLKSHKGKGLILDIDIISLQPGVGLGLRTEGRTQVGLLGRYVTGEFPTHILVGPYVSVFLGMDELKPRPYLKAFVAHGLNLEDDTSPILNKESLAGVGMSLGFLYSGSKWLRIFFEGGMGIGRQFREEVVNDPSETTIQITEYIWRPIATIGLEF